jgi:cyclase
MELKAYLHCVREESTQCVELELTSLEASKRFDGGPYGEWRAPARPLVTVGRACRESRSEPADALSEVAKTFDSLYDLAGTQRAEVEL